MNRNEKDLVRKLVHNNISKEEFIKIFPTELNEYYILNGFRASFSDKNSSDLEDFISIINFDSDWANNSSYAKILCSLLGEAWHTQHENIASLLQGLKNPETVDCLYQAALNKPKYMDYDDSYSLARKCIHALGDINTDQAKEKLKLLAQSDIPIIREKAEKQLYYYKR